MKTGNNLQISTSPQTHPAGKPRSFASLSLQRRSAYGRERRCNAGKELDAETGLYYYGARYLDPKTGRWLSGDPALGEYVPSAPVNEEAKKRNGSLPGMGGVFNYANLHVYHYAGNNPVKYVDPDGRTPGDPFDTADEAAIDALNYINPKSIKDNIEFAGVIYQDPKTQKFYATEPQEKGSGTKANAGRAPADTNNVGEYHTHGNYSIENPGGILIPTGDPNRDSLNSDDFSPDDISLAHIRLRFHPGFKAYLGTPSGKYLKYAPETNEHSFYTPSTGAFITRNTSEPSNGLPIFNGQQARPGNYTSRDLRSYFVP